MAKKRADKPSAQKPTAVPDDTNALPPTDGGEAVSSDNAARAEEHDKSTLPITPDEYLAIFGKSILPRIAESHSEYVRLLKLYRAYRNHSDKPEIAKAFRTNFEILKKSVIPVLRESQKTALKLASLAIKQEKQEAQKATKAAKAATVAAEKAEKEQARSLSANLTTYAMETLTFCRAFVAEVSNLPYSDTQVLNDLRRLDIDTAASSGKFISHDVLELFSEKYPYFSLNNFSPIPSTLCGIAFRSNAIAPAPIVVVVNGTDSVPTPYYLTLSATLKSVSGEIMPTFVPEISGNRRNTLSTYSLSSSDISELLVKYNSVHNTEFTLCTPENLNAFYERKEIQTSETESVMLSKYDVLHSLFSNAENALEKEQHFIAESNLL
jgi:hypothetical protein